MSFWIAIGESDHLHNDALRIGFFCIDLFFDQEEEETLGFFWPETEEVK